MYDDHSLGSGFFQREPSVHWSLENHSVTEDVGGGGLDEGQNHGDGTR